MARSTHCPANERIKRRYLHWLAEAKGYSTASVDMAAAAISRFETHTGYRDFKRFHVEQARAFKHHLSAKAMAAQSGSPLSKATISSTLRALHAFFMWLADQPGYRSAIRYSDAAYFSPQGQDERIAAGHREKPGPEIDDILMVLRAMPAATGIERRDRAVVAFILLTGARDRAVASLKLKHLDIAKATLFQDAREVRTKRGKTIVTAFFPVGDEPLQIVTDWVAYLRTELHFGPDDPLFPATQVALDGNRQFAPTGLSRGQWTTSAPIRKLFRAAFKRARLPYHNPHSFRSTLARLGEQVCRTPEDFKAWSQNLGHSGVLTTFSAYGKVSEHRQCEIIAGLAHAQGEPVDAVAKLEAVLRDMKAAGR